ncbi:NADH-quinone oxidoreductase subunit J family protein [Paludisphaera rhizosphaerae]|uniref:NADH-quinone oxidoreductase subunit J family protein n=1 Tax=Paludisphaera rhizosphaerae TaxID=2711216 RepID=UPI0013EA178A|nr:NADH-quinone oxidoreductase subunit J [Paludisphaera rhizosphaerae]
MNGSMILATIGVVLGATGTYILLPHSRGDVKSRNNYILGGVLAGLGLIGFLLLLTPPDVSPNPAPADFSSLGMMITGACFYLFAAGAIGTAVMTVTSRNPVYSALWFTGVIVSTAGLFLLIDAQFLAAGTVIVYAGAIIVTFLFVIMLAQMEGKAVYDRAAKTPGRAVFTSFLLLWSLMYCLAVVPGSHRPPTAGANDPLEDRLRRGRELAEYYRGKGPIETKLVLERALRPTSSLFFDGDHQKPKPNVAGLGEALYADHLLTVEMAGAILFAALIAAVLIANPKPLRPVDAPTEA